MELLSPDYNLDELLIHIQRSLELLWISDTKLLVVRYTGEKLPCGILSQILPLDSLLLRLHQSEHVNVQQTNISRAEKHTAITNTFAGEDAAGARHEVDVDHRRQESHQPLHHRKWPGWRRYLATSNKT